MLVVDIDQKEKQLNIVYRLGEDLSQSPSLSDEDRTKLNEDVTILKNRWTSLREKVETINTRYGIIHHYYYLMLFRKGTNLNFEQEIQNRCELLNLCNVVIMNGENEEWHKTILLFIH